MKLTVATPLAVITEAEDVAHVRAEDETGAFGILPGHANFLTALTLSVISWRDSAGQEHHIAVRGGVLEVAGGAAVTIASREAVADDDLHRLETNVIAGFHKRNQEEQAARTDERRLYLSAIERIFKLLEPTRGSSPSDMQGLAAPGSLFR